MSETGFSTLSQSSISSILEVKKRKLAGPLETAFKNVSSFSEGGTKHSKITNLILYFICKDNRPFNVTQGIGFKRLLKELAPLYKIPSQETLKHKIDLKYDTAVSIYKRKFSDIPNFAITCDIWTETMSMRSFIGISHKI